MLRYREHHFMAARDLNLATQSQAAGHASMPDPFTMWRRDSSVQLMPGSIRHVATLRVRMGIETELTGGTVGPLGTAYGFENSAT